MRSKASAIWSPKPIPCDELSAGEVGFLFATIKTVSDAQIGDTITDAANPASEPLPGFEPLKAMVFAGLYPVEIRTNTACFATRWKSFV